MATTILVNEKEVGWFGDGYENAETILALLNHWAGVSHNAHIVLEVDYKELMPEIEYADAKIHIPESMSADVNLNVFNPDKFK